MTEIEGFDPERTHPAFRDLELRLAETGHEAAWFATVREALETAYLASESPYEQSGTTSDAGSWRRKRSPIVEAIDRDGTFLDIGAANGLLMDTLTVWAAERGYHIEPYGLDISSRLADLARSRYPQWAGRIFVGNCLTWRPPEERRFDFVRTELEYVPVRRWSDLVAHLLQTVVAPDGRLVVCSYGSARRPAPRVQDIATILHGFGYPVAGTASAAAPNGVMDVMVAWIDAASQDDGVNVRTGREDGQATCIRTASSRAAGIDRGRPGERPGATSPVVRCRSRQRHRLETLTSKRRATSTARMPDVKARNDRSRRSTE